MGRTNPTYRDFLDEYEQRWQKYRRGLRRQYQPEFDRLFEHARQHADAAGYMNATDPEVAVLMSMLLAHELVLADLTAALERLEE